MFLLEVVRLDAGAGGKCGKCTYFVELRPARRFPHQGRVPHIPDFLSRFVGSANSMRLSLQKGAHAVLSGAAYRKFGASRSFFARCGIPLTFLLTLDASDALGDQNWWYPTSREKRARCGAPGLRVGMRFTGRCGFSSRRWHCGWRMGPGCCSAFCIREYRLRPRPQRPR